MRPRGRDRAVALVAALTIMALLLVLGAAVIRRQAEAYKSSNYVRQTTKAQALAEAGLEDARIKLEKDRFFPPPHAPDQLVFDYTETLTDSDGRPGGGYSVSVDLSRASDPFFIILVRSTGLVEPEKDGGARQTLIAEFDNSPHHRDDPERENPSLCRILRIYPGP